MPSDPAEGRDVCLDQIVMTGLWGDTRLTNTKRLTSQIVLFYVAQSLSDMRLPS